MSDPFQKPGAPQGSGFLPAPIADLLRRMFLRREGAVLAGAPEAPDAPAGDEVLEGGPAKAESGIWKSGIARIDEQHQAMFDAIRNLQAAIRAGEGAQGIQEVVAFLERYTRDHFALEEAYMERLAFPDLAGHRREHQAFLLQVRAARDRAEAGDGTLALELTRLLYEWLRAHVLREDVAYRDFARARRRG